MLTPEQEENSKKLCECGCGQPVTYNKYRQHRFVHNHHLKNNTHSLGKKFRHKKLVNLPRICKDCGKDEPLPRRFTYKTQQCYTCRYRDYIKKMDSKLPHIRCKCGCGTLIPSLSRRKRPKEYVHGHRPKPDITRQMEEYKKKAQKKPRVFYQGNNRSGLMPGPAGIPGISISSNGYIMVKLYDNFPHPRKTKLGYVAAHTLIMEETIGRYLHPWEYVEHINQNPSDNRLSNIRLRIRHTAIVRNRMSGASGTILDDKGNIKLKCKVSYLLDKTLYRRRGKDICYETVWGNDDALEHMRKEHGLFLQQQQQQQEEENEER
jgi:hypothetical protein